MIYAYLIDPLYRPDFLILLFLLVSLTVGALLTFWIHDTVQYALVPDEDKKKPASAKILLKTVLASRDTWIAVAALCLFGVAWRKTVPHKELRRGRSFLLGLLGPLTCFAVSVVAFLLIRAFFYGQLTLPVYFFKAVFRASFYTSLFSLIPMASCDGGTMLHAVLPGALQDPYKKTAYLADIVTIAAGVLLAVTGVVTQIVL